MASTARRARATIAAQHTVEANNIDNGALDEGSNNNKAAASAARRAYVASAAAANDTAAAFAARRPCVTMAA